MQDDQGNLLKYKDSPRCKHCEIRLDGYRSSFFIDYQMADVCGECILSYFDKDEQSLSSCILEYVRSYPHVKNAVLV